MRLRFFSEYSDTSSEINPKNLQILLKFYLNFPTIFPEFSQDFLKNFIKTNLSLFFANSQKFSQNIF